MEWSDNLSVHIKIIDKQHKHFIGIMNKLFEAIQTDEKDAVPKIIDELADYANVHFATEESYFDRFNYEGAEEHITEHTKIKLKIIKFLARKDDDPFKVGYDLLDLLEDWLFKHLAKMDKKYIKTFNEHGLR
jgi:hemerythrin-like metal-binding protein